MNPEVASSISVFSGLRERGKKEELAYDHPGHFHEYAFNQTLAIFHWEIYDLVLENAQLEMPSEDPVLILAPRDHAKTTLVAESYPLWKIGRDPSELVQIICSTTTKARERLRKIASCIQHNERFRNLFGELHPGNDPAFLWSRDELEVKRNRAAAWETGKAERDPTVHAFGISTSVEGGRATLQVYDDIVTYENSRTVVGRQFTTEKFWSSFDPMLLPKGQQISIGTRFHYADFYSECIRKFDRERLYTDLYDDEEVEDGIDREG